MSRPAPLPGRLSPPEERLRPLPRPARRPGMVGRPPPSARVRRSRPGRRAPWRRVPVPRRRRFRGARPAVEHPPARRVERPEQLVPHRPAWKPFPKRRRRHDEPYCRTARGPRRAPDRPQPVVRMPRTDHRLRYPVSNPERSRRPLRREPSGRKHLPPGPRVSQTAAVRRPRGWETRSARGQKRLAEHAPRAFPFGERPPAVARIRSARFRTCRLGWHCCLGGRPCRPALPRKRIARTGLPPSAGID